MLTVQGLKYKHPLVLLKTDLVLSKKEGKKRNLCNNKSCDGGPTIKSSIRQ